MIFILIKNIFNFLNKFAPVETAQNFDNVGLLFGNLNDIVTKAIVAVDLNVDVLKIAKKLDVQLIIVHHPIIFKPVKRILKTDFLFEIVQSKINVIAMHTNLDVALKGVSFCLAKFLELNNIEVLPNSDGFGRVGFLKHALTYEEFLTMVSKKFKNVLTAVKISGFVKKIAVVSGAGGFALNAAKNFGTNVLLTGECKHNEFVDAFNCGFGLIAAGHFETENVVCEFLKNELELNFKNVSFVVVNSKTNFSFYGDLKWL